ncbi:MAG TPA: twin-arginine translocation signal domain-containing protein [Solirubrobacterales bacterium]|nr:twin-arginine translocation signal domain-containing protein [Solirubrobacterales bacterium]
MNGSPSTRRNFLTRAGVAAGALAATFGLPAGALGEGRRHHKRVWKLAPDGPQYDCSASQQAHHNCHGCNACQSHAKNKLFASKKAAKRNRHRAHPGCRCGVKRGRKLSRAKWQDLFRPGDKKRGMVDKRDPRVRRILDS